MFGVRRVLWAIVSFTFCLQRKDHSFFSSYVFFKYHIQARIFSLILFLPDHFFSLYFCFCNIIFFQGNLPFPILSPKQIMVQHITSDYQCLKLWMIETHPLILTPPPPSFSLLVHKIFQTSCTYSVIWLQKILDSVTCLSGFVLQNCCVEVGIVIKAQDHCWRVARWM